MLDTNCDEHSSYKKSNDDIISLQNKFVLLEDKINEDFIDLKKNENTNIFNYEKDKINNLIIQNDLIFDESVDDIEKENINEYFLNEKNEIDKIHNEFKIFDDACNMILGKDNLNENIKNSNELYKNNKELYSIENINENSNISIDENNESLGYTKEEKYEYKKMEIKIKQLLNLINILKKQLNKKDEEIYKIESHLSLNESVCNLQSVISNEMSEKKSDICENDLNNDLLIDKMKILLISQNNEIRYLKEELKLKEKEMLYLIEENNSKNEKLEEIKKELEKNYMILNNYKDLEKEKGLNKKLEYTESSIFSENKKIKKILNVNEKKLNIEIQKRIINTLNEEVKKKESIITELKNAIDNIEIKNNVDIIKYKQSNIDLCNKLSLNNSLLNNQKLEIENLHINYKELEEYLKNKDIEIKKLHEIILEKEKENNKLKTDFNKIKFDLDVKKLNLMDTKEKIKNIYKENILNLEKQKEMYINNLNKECNNRDKIIEEKDNEIKKLMDKINKINDSYNEMKKIIEKLNQELCKKDKSLHELQEKFIDTQAKLLIYENDNIIQKLKKNEEILKKKLDEQIYKNEQLVDNSLLLQKTTLENNNLEKNIIELRGIIYAKDEEIKKLKEKNKKNQKINSNDNFTLNKNIYICSNNNEIISNISKNEKTKYIESLVDDSVLLKTENINSAKKDAVDLSLLNYFCNNKCNCKIKKIEKNIYLLNDKKVTIKFINGDLYVEDNNMNPIKLQNYLFQHNY